MTRRSDDIALVGVACVFPKAPDARGFWENILGRVDAIGDPPGDWGGEHVYDPEATDPDQLYTKRGGYIGDLARFNPFEYGVMPRSVDGGEPEHFLALRLAHDALKDAGYHDRPFNRESTQVILGRGTYANRGFITVLQHTFAINQVIRLLGQLHPEHTPDELERLRKALKASLPPFNSETAPSLPHSVMAGRIANRLDLMGPAYSIDAACASTLIAVDLGIKDLLSGKSDMVLAGGVQISTSFPIALLFSHLGALSRAGAVRPFHPDADGTLLGEGAGVVALKRLKDAEKDGDRIYAVVKGIGTSSDGRALGLLAPRVEGEELALRRAYDRTGISPDTIGLIEAHGTGTPVGDATEIEALGRVFGPQRNGHPTCALGAVKSMIGHSIPASGAAGLIKTAMALHHRILPPTLHALNPNPKLEGSPFYLVPEARPWIHSGDAPRRAGVSSFGFGGINAHAILEEYRPETTSKSFSFKCVHSTWDAEMVLVSGGTRDELIASCRGVRRYLDADPDVALADLAYTLNCPGPDAGAHRIALVAKSLDELKRKLDFAIERLGESDCDRIKDKTGIFFFAERMIPQGKLAFLFPGEGAQYDGMLAGLALHFPEVREWFDLMDGAFRSHERGFVPSQVIFPVPGGKHDDQDALWQMESAIEAVFTANQAMHTLLDGLGLKPDAIVGHSTGEYSALLASGAAVVEHEERLVEHILDGNEATEAAKRQGLVPAGVLLAVGPADPDLIRTLPGLEEGTLFMAMDNCPHQVVICGDEDAIERAQKSLRAGGAVCQRLAFDRAYHTPLFAPVCNELRGFYDRATFTAPRVPLYSCMTAAPVPDDPVEVRRLALEQWANPVRFRETIENMYEDGVRFFVEVGPRGNLTAFVGDILRGKPHLAVASNSPRRSDLMQLHHMLAYLSAQGAQLTLERLYEGRVANRLPLEAVLAGEAPSRPPDRMMTLSLALPELKLDDAALSAHARPEGKPAPETAKPAAPALAERPLAAAPSQAAPAPAPSAPPVASAAAALAAAAGTQPESARSQVMRQFLSNMDDFLETQEEVMRDVLARSAGRNGTHGAAAPSHATVDAPRPDPAWPFAAGPVQRQIGGKLVMRRRLSLDEDVFLLDHTLGGRVSEDPSLKALSVLPLAMTLEMVAEAAAMARPGPRPVAMEAVRVHRWLSFDAPGITVEITAAPSAPGDRVAVQVWELHGTTDDAPKSLAVEGTVVLAAGFPAAPPAERLDLKNERTSRWRPEALYAPGERHGMFHGPSLRGVVSLDRVGADGIEGTLRALPVTGLFRSRPAPTFLMDSVMIDVASQLVGYWTAEVLDRNFVVFPVGFERLEFYAPPLAAPAQARGLVRCGMLEDGGIRADLDIAGPDGRLLTRIRGWEVRRSDLPDDVYAFRQAPRDFVMSRPLPDELCRAHGVTGCRLRFPGGFLETGQRIWRDSLAHLALSPAERRIWGGLSGKDDEREIWLRERLVAKDAVRLFLVARYGERAYSSDIDITNDLHGRLIAKRKQSARVERASAISTAISGETAVAVAGEPGAEDGIGIHVERVSGNGLQNVPSDVQDRVGDLPPEHREEWSLRMQCAKRAAAKALGPDVPEPVIHELDIIRGKILLRGKGGLSRKSPDLLGATTYRDGNDILAVVSVEGIPDGK